MVREKVGQAPALTSWESVDVAGREMGLLQNRIDRITAERDGEVNAVQARYEAQLRPLQEGIALQAKAIAEFCQTRQAEFDKARTRTLTWIKVSFRMSSRLATAAKWTWEKVLDALKNAGRDKLIRTKEEVDKELVRTTLSEEELKPLGMKIVTVDTFGYELLKAPEIKAGERAA